jgi:glycosyltransferase involved in cell wall biosynthesis
MNSSNSNLLVSIFCITYNHEKYINKTIQGFLLQKTNFDIEIVIGEDCSSDKTREIINEYVNKNNLNIKIVTSENNVGLKDNVSRTMKACNGKYIAICEGDDYWTDPLKLQKQVDFLENNSDYVLVGHNASIINENGDIINTSKLKSANMRDASSFELQKGFWVLTLTACFRNVFKDAAPKILDLVSYDSILFSYLGAFGKYKYMSEIENSMYRIHSGGLYSNIDNKQKNILRDNMVNNLSEFYYQNKNKKLGLYYSNIWKKKKEKNEIEISNNKGKLIYIYFFLKRYYFILKDSSFKELLNKISLY